MATVTVHGEAAADVPPDRVRLQVAVQAEAATAAEALTGLTGRAAELDRLLAAAGELVLLRRPSTVTVQPTWSPTGGRQRPDGAAVDDGGGRARRGAGLAAGPARRGARRDAGGHRLGGRPGQPGAPPAAGRRGRRRPGPRQDYAQAAGLRLGAVEWIAEPGAGRPPEPGRARRGRVRSLDASGGQVLELRSEPVAVVAAVDVRYALLPGQDG